MKGEVLVLVLVVAAAEGMMDFYFEAKWQGIGFLGCHDCCGLRERADVPYFLQVWTLDWGLIYASAFERPYKRPKESYSVESILSPARSFYNEKRHS